MTFTLEEEKRFALLTSIISLGGSGTKKQVLDNLQSNDFLSFNKSDLQVMATRSELYWRNDLAFIRKHLVDEYKIDDSQWNSWAITGKGRSYFLALYNRIKNEEIISFTKLTKSTIRIAKGIIANDTSNWFLLEDEIPEPTLYPEGSTKMISVNYYERNLNARNACLDHFGLSCLVCNFNFGSYYGKFAEGYIHVHHIIPLSEINNEYEVNPIEDLIPVCPNCHAMLHLGKPALTIDEVRSHIL